MDQIIYYFSHCITQRFPSTNILYSKAKRVNRQIKPDSGDHNTKKYLKLRRVRSQKLLNRKVLNLFQEVNLNSPLCETVLVKELHIVCH